MDHIRSATVSRILRAGVGLVALSAMLSVRAAEQPTAGDLAELRQAVERRFEVVPLTRGVALAGRTPDRRVEIAGGVVSSHGVPLSGDELRRRFTADADLVLRLSYLSDDQLGRLFATAAAAPAAADAPTQAPAPPAPALPAPPAPVPAPSAVAPAPPAPAPEVASGRPTPARRRSGARLAFAKDIVVAADEEVRDGVFSLGGDVRIAGAVRDEVVVVGGRLDLTQTAEVGGDITIVGGELAIADGARHTGRVHRVSRADWPRWAGPGIDWAWFEPRGAGRWVGAVGSLVRIAVLALAVIALTALAGSRVTRIGAAAGDSPLKAAGVGLATQLLFVPLLVVGAILLAVTIVGIPFVAVLVPLAVVTLFVAMLVGFTGVVCALGGAVGDRVGWRPGSPVLAALGGLLVIVLPALVFQALALTPGPLPTRLPLALASLVEYVAWTIGLGAAVMTGLGRWAVVPPPVPPAAYDSMREAPSRL